MNCSQPLNTTGQDSNPTNMASGYSGLDLECALATGGVGMTFSKLFYQTDTMEAAKDGGALIVCNVAAQAVSLGKMLPLPSSLTHVTDAIATGLAYGALNAVHRTSPFDHMTAQILSAACYDYIGEHVVLPAIRSVAPM